ncbi:MAG: gluconate 2-dehydrogenase subunit 3 family protein [Steroidobacteraceae bacterium]|nr:gluconate 2-dehydrogenase subunit 3 family protein [Steroidobacteraceae bacterium]
MSYETHWNTGPHLSPHEAEVLRAVAGFMIPASSEYDVPGADDAAIFAEIAATLGRDTDVARKGLRRLEEIAGSRFAGLATEQKNAALLKLAGSDLPLLSALVMVVARCYYRDDRVMRSLGMEVRPPFPQGFELEQGDWSLLDPVKARGRIWRDAK